jgi:nitrate reductase NapD
MSESESNICGLVVHARPGLAQAVQGRLIALPGVEVHASTPDDRLVVTVEDAGDRRCLDTVTRLQDIEGVLSTALVYQHSLQD